MNQGIKMYPFQRQLLSMVSKGIQPGQRLNSIVAGRRAGKSQLDEQVRQEIERRRVLLEPSKAAWDDGGRTFAWFAHCSGWTRCLCKGNYIEQSEWLAQHGAAGLDWRVRVKGTYSDILKDDTTREWFIRDSQTAYLFALRFSSDMNRGVDF